MEHTQHQQQKIKQQQVVLYVTEGVEKQHPPSVSIQKNYTFYKFNSLITEFKFKHL